MSSRCHRLHCSPTQLPNFGLWCHTAWFKTSIMTRCIQFIGERLRENDDILRIMLCRQSTIGPSNMDLSWHSCPNSSSQDETTWKSLILVIECTTKILFSSYHSTLQGTGSLHQSRIFEFKTPAASSCVPIWRWRVYAHFKAVFSPYGKTQKWTPPSLRFWHIHTLWVECSDCWMTCVLRGYL